ncbi:hypothetical protein [Streptosporangium sp. NPDC049078]|uniref:hypothetical protein n=1 Tax=Streptosporangium sp. NPDC049078 TaxID=3155767 RepID=UPI00342B77BC
MIPSSLPAPTVSGHRIGRLEFTDVAGLRMLTDLCRDGTAHLINAPIDIRRLLGLLNRTDILDKCA